MNNALSWVNRFETTHLRRTTRALLRHISDPGIEETNRLQMIETAVEQSRENADPFEFPELMLYLAGFYFARQDACMAMEYARKARADLQAFADGSHMLAVSCWILGITAWKCGDNNLAFSAWYQARRMFVQLAVQQEKEEKNVNAQWYREALVRINMEMICKAEEAYSWLDLFDSSRLSGRTHDLVNEITEVLNRDWLTESDKQSIGGLVNELHSLGTNSLDPLESAEVLVECAMIVFRLGNIAQARDLLQKAVETFPPQSHQRAVTLWLLGIVEWYMVDCRSRAVIHGDDCLDMMGSLIRIDQQAGRTKRANWYRQKRDFMARVIEKRKKALETAGKG